MVVHKQQRGQTGAGLTKQKDAEKDRIVETSESFIMIVRPLLPPFLSFGFLTIQAILESLTVP